MTIRTVGAVAASLVMTAGLGTSAAVASPQRKAARAACKAERAQIGVPAFRQKYGAPGAMKHCIAAHGGGNPNPRPRRHPGRGHGQGDNQGNGGDFHANDKGGVPNHGRGQGRGNGND